MSELQSVYIDRTGDWCRSGNNTGKFYIKEEADKVIAELEESHKKEVGQLLMEIAELNRKFGDYRYTIAVLRKETSHNKYKRCLAMAISCEADAKLNQEFAADASEYMPSYEARFQRLAAYYEKWRKRWLKLAEDELVSSAK